MTDNKTIMVHRKHKKTCLRPNSLDYVTILKHTFQISLTAKKLIPPKSSEKTENKNKILQKSAHQLYSFQFIVLFAN